MFSINFRNNLLNRTSVNCFQIQDMYESYLFDTFLFNITDVKHFTFNSDFININFIENLANSYKRALFSKFPEFDIEKFDCSFVIGSKCFMKRLYNYTQIANEKTMKGLKCNFTTLNSEFSMLYFIKNHLTKFSIESSTEQKASYLYNVCKIFQYKIKTKQCEDIFFMFIVEDRNVFYQFEIYYDYLKRDDNKLKEFFREIGESIECNDKLLAFEYQQGNDMNRISIDVFTIIEKHELIFDLWNEFVKYSNSDLIYIIINKRYKEFVTPCFKKLRYDYLLQKSSKREYTIKVSGTFEESIDKLTKIFGMFGDKMLKNIHKSYQKVKVNDLQVLFMSQNLFKCNFLTYLNIYNNKVNKLHTEL
ncbi:hypothetical protein COBT_001482 [Conglomerata obtusa]